MKKIPHVVLTLSLLTCYAVNIAQAGRFEDRQARQERRIASGVANGSINAAEAQKLNRQQQHIQNVENKFEADGNINQNEAKRLNRLENKASRNIWMKRHN